MDMKNEYELKDTARTSSTDLDKDVPVEVDETVGDFVGEYTPEDRKDMRRMGKKQELRVCMAISET